MARDAAIWFVMIGGEQAGPMSRVELGLELATGTIDSSSLIWKDGMADWKPGSAIPELAALFAPEAPEPRPAGRPTARASARAAAGPRAKPLRIAPPTGPAPRPAAKAAARPAARTVTATEPQQAQGRAKGMMEFDTAHFRLSDLPEKTPEPTPKKALVEFDTAHFRLGDLAKQQPDPKLTLDLNVRDFEEGVVGYVDPSAPVAKVAAQPSRKPAAAARPAVAAPPKGARAVTAMPALRPMRSAPLKKSSGTSPLSIGVMGGAALAAAAVLWLLLK